MSKLTFLLFLVSFGLATMLTSSCDKSDDPTPIDSTKDTIDLVNGDYWPLEVGNYWVYVYSDTFWDGDTFYIDHYQETMRVVSSQVIDSMTFYRVENVFGFDFRDRCLIPYFDLAFEDNRLYMYQEEENQIVMLVDFLEPEKDTMYAYDSSISPIWFCCRSGYDCWMTNQKVLSNFYHVKEWNFFDLPAFTQLFIIFARGIGPIWNYTIDGGSYFGPLVHMQSASINGNYLTADFDKNEIWNLFLNWDE